MRSTRVVSSCGGYLKATAQRGELAGRAQPALQVEVVHLHHDAVGVVGEGEAALGHPSFQRFTSAIPRQSRFSGFTSKPQRGQRLQLLPVGGPGPGSPGHERLVGDEGERAGGGDAPVELPQRAGRGVARVGEGRLALPASSRGSWPRSAPSAGAPRRAPRAAAAARPRRRAEHAAVGAQPRRRCGGSAVTSSPMAPSPRVEPCGERAVLVDELHRQPVELGLADVARPAPRAAGRAAGGPGRRTRRAPRRWSRCRARAWARGARPWRTSRRAPRRPAGWASRACASAGWASSSAEQLPHEPVVLGVGEDRAVEDVVGVVRLADPRPELVDALRRAVGHARSVTRGAGRGGNRGRRQKMLGSAAGDLRGQHEGRCPYPL